MKMFVLLDVQDGVGHACEGNESSKPFTEILLRKEYATKYLLDTGGRITQTQDSLNNYTYYYFDLTGKLTMVRDALNNDTNFEHNADGKLQPMFS